MTCPASFTQRAFRGRNDDGNETTATWKANQDTNWTQAVDVNFRVRFQMQEGAACAGNNKVWRMQYNKNAAGWIDCSASSLVVLASASPNLANAANLTTQLTGGTGTFQGATGFNEVDCNAGGASMDVAASGNSECEFSVQLRSADTVNGDSVQLRVTDAGTAIAAYTSTPTITVSAPISVALTGQSATASAGALVASVSTALTGTSSTASAGTLVPSTSYSVALTGNEATVSAGTLAASASLALAGTEATASSGSVAASVSIALTGNEASVAIGTLTPGAGGSPVSVALTGIEATSAIGILLATSNPIIAEPAVISNFSLREWRRWHRPEDEKRLSELGITPAAAEIIADVAARQAEDRRFDDQQRLEELRGEMRLRGLEMQSKHLQALNDERERIIDNEIRLRLNLVQENSDISLLLMTAALD